MDYTGLLKYPEFDYDTVYEKYTIEADENEAGEPSMVFPDFVFDTKIAHKYLVLVYSPESEYADIKDLSERKELAMKKSGIERKYRKKIMTNENPMIGDMLTRFFRVYEDFDYELIISAKEALITLLEVVRKPINTHLQDDKERNAVKAKRECFDDAKYIMDEIRKMLAELGSKSNDAKESVKSSVFQGGFAEKLAE